MQCWTGTGHAGGKNALVRLFYAHTFSQSMARGAQKRVSHTNAQAVKTLTYGFVVANTVFVCATWLWPPPAPYWTWTLYAVTELVAALVAWQLVSMARSGDDLAQRGLTAYMFDFVYITWFVHVGASLVWRRLWWTYAVIPLYVCYLFYKHVLVKYVFPRWTGTAAPTSTQAPGAPPAADGGMSKRQAKMQARQAKGRAVRR